MKKNEREENWKSISKKVKDVNNNVFDDINNLNEDDSFSPIEEVEEKVPLTEEEKKSVRKKLFILLIIIIIVIIALITIRIIEPYSNKETNNDETEEAKDNESDENEEKIDEAETLILELEDGVISSTNYELISLIDEIKYNLREYYVNDTIELFKNNNTNISTLTNRKKLFLVSKTKEFNTLISNQMTGESLCDNNIIIGISDIDKILKDRFNTNVTAYEQFAYSYYFEKEFVNNIIFTKKDNNYIGTCSNTTNKIVQLSEQKFISATKKDNKIYIDMKVVFIKESGVYKDPSFTTLITNDVQKTEEEYFLKANTYRYTYDITDTNYVLTNVSLLK